jgi:hypothetical protein
MLSLAVSPGVTPALQISGTATVAGTLAVRTTGRETARFQIITASSSSGRFAATQFTGEDYTLTSGRFGLVLTGPPIARPPQAKVLPAIAGGSRVIRVTLFCPAGGAGCARVTVRATITVRHRPGTVIATRSVALRAGATRRLALRLDRAGRALLARLGRLPATVTVRAGHARLARATVTVRRPKEKKTPHSRGL